MGLAERRGLARFQDGGYPDWKARIDAAAGFDLLPATNVGDVGERTAALVGLLEANL